MPEELTPFLMVWQDHQSGSALRNLVAFLGENTGPLLQQGVLLNDFWEERPAHMRQAINWLKNPSTLKHFERKSQTISLDHQELASEIAKIIGYLKQLQN